jgi:DNA mismatch endonuclease (patch repair protein)
VTENPETRSRIMRAVKGRDTGGEMVVRRLLHRMGYRYRLHRAELPGKPDVAFPCRRKAIFVHGCFWHGHDCARGARMPKSNRDYWTAKITRNATRDARNGECLQAMGWSVLTLWECELKDEPTLAGRLRSFVGASRFNI